MKVLRAVEIVASSNPRGPRRETQVEQHKTYSRLVPLRLVSVPMLDGAKIQVTGLYHIAFVQKTNQHSDFFTQEIADKVQIGLEKVKQQLKTAGQAAHDENKRNFEEHKQRINNLFGDMEIVVTNLSETLVQCIRGYTAVADAKEGTSWNPKGMRSITVLLCT